MFQFLRCHFLSSPDRLPGLPCFQVGPNLSVIPLILLVSLFWQARRGLVVPHPHSGEITLRPWLPSRITPIRLASKPSSSINFTHIATSPSSQAPNYFASPLVNALPSPLRHSQRRYGLVESRRSRPCGVEQFGPFCRDVTREGGAWICLEVLKEDDRLSREG